MQDVLDPGARRVDKNLRSRLQSLSVFRASQVDMPCVGHAPRRYELRPRQHRAAPSAHVQRVQDNQARIVDPAVRIFKSAAESLAQRLALGRL